MITIFSIPKPFYGSIGIMQKNAIRSWQLLKPTPEIVLFGQDKGVAEAALQLGVSHIPDVKRNGFGTPLIDSVFDTIQSVAKHNVLAYVNTDIILFQNFIHAVEKIPFREYLIVGRRWDIDIQEEIEFDSNWEKKISNKLRYSAELHTHWGADYFIFCMRDIWKIPPFAVGRMIWDNWLIYSARKLGMPVIDGTDAITAIHQNHGYSSKLLNEDGKCNWENPEIHYNLELAGGHQNTYNIYDARWILKNGLLLPAFGYSYLRQLWNRYKFRNDP